MRNGALVRFVYAVAITSLTGCLSADRPAGPVRDAGPGLAQALGATFRMSRADWSAIARNVPGFGGVWMDGDTLVIAMSRPSGAPLIRDAALAWLLSGGRSDLLRKPHRLVSVRHDIAELESYLVQLATTAVSTPAVVALWIDPKRSRAMVGVADTATLRFVRQHALSKGVPVDAYDVELQTPLGNVSCTTLQSACSPLVAGLRVVNISGNSECTLGLVGWKVDSLQPSQPDTSYKVVMSASHCTSTQTQVAGDVAFQPGPSRDIGYEVDEAPVYGATYCEQFPPYVYPQCRYADVAVYRVRDSVAVAGGYTALANSVKGSMVPSYLGSALYTGSGVIGVLVGEGIVRIGATSGQKSGVVTTDCIDRRYGFTTLWTFCMQRANVSASLGDSGGLVYMPSGGGSAPTPRPAGVIAQNDPDNPPGMFYSKIGLVMGALGWQYFVAW